ncbi:MAG: VWA domain-containing protein [Pirellulales bacterium]|nr:VWA domain-containing protein [Pirellulales bacterium]
MKTIHAALTGLIVVAGWLAAAPAGAGLNVVVVLDDSGSMQGRLASDARMTRMDAAKQALLTVLDKLPPDAKVGILALNSQNRSGEPWIHPLTTIDPDKLRQAVQGIRASGNTPLGQRMMNGANAILKLRAKQHYGTYRLLVVTDGEATDGPILERNLPNILARGIWIDVIGVDMDQGHSLATQVQTYREADDPASLEKAIAEVFAETTGDSGVAGESDFEIIEPIPSEVATAALAALAQPDNDPVDRRAAPGQDAPGAPMPAVPPGPRRPGDAATSRVQDGPSLLGSCCGGLCVGGIILVILLVVMAAAKRPRRF